MLGLVQYSDSEDEREEAQTAASDRQQLGAAATAAAAARPQQQVQARPAPASGLPSAADLLECGALQVRLPPPDFGQGPAAAAGRQQVGLAPAAAAGAKRGHPDTRGPLPNPMSLDAKVPRSGGALNVGGAKPSTATGGLLLPPQLRGRANVATEDLSTMFTKEAVQRAQQRRSSGGGASGLGGGGS